MPKRLYSRIGTKNSPNRYTQLKNKTRNIIILSILAVSFWFGLIYINNNYYPIWSGNEIKVSTKSSTDVKKVKVEFGISACTINRASDLELFKNHDSYITVYENGQEQSNIYNEYGENDFLLTYNDRYYLSFRHFKLNRKAQHDYSFEFYKRNSQLFVDVCIEGEYPMSFEHRMIPIDSASYYRCNILKEESGVIYNGIELN